MTTHDLQGLLRTFQRQVSRIRLLQAAGVAGLLAAVTWAAGLAEPTHGRAMLVIGATGLIIWLLVVLNAIRLNADVRTGSMLLASGQLDDAEIWFRRAIERFSLSARAKMVACQELASVFFRRDAHREVVAICQRLLRHRMKRLGHVWINTRFMLADSLLMLDRVNEAYEALRPVYGGPLSLADRMKLLPIQLRYELAADHNASAAAALAEKVEIAELLDSPRAALVHALLAEACRREGMTAQHNFLAERARLYCDLDKLAGRYAVIAPIAADRKQPQNGG